MEKDTPIEVTSVQRPTLGEKYWYILPHSLKPTHTNDWHYETDNERWESGNYFLDQRAAAECAEGLEELRTRMEANAAARNNIDTIFITEVLDLSRYCHIVPDRKKPKAEQEAPDTDAAAAALAEAIGKYNKAKEWIRKERASLTKQVWEQIAISPKCG